MFGSRIQVAVLVFLGFLLVCIGKLADLQLWKYPKYALAALTSLTSEELVPAPRGRILDCNGRVLAEDVPSFDISVKPRALELRELPLKSMRRIRDIRSTRLTEYIPKLAAGYAAFGKPEYRPVFRTEFEKVRAEVTDLKDPPAAALKRLRYLHYRAERGAAIDRLAGQDPTVAELAAAAGVPALRLAEGLVDAMEHAAKNFGGAPPPAVTDISREAWDRLRLRQHYPLISGQLSFPGIVMTTSVRRLYPHGRAACHVLGYVKPLSEEQYLDLARDSEGIRVRDRSRNDGEKQGSRWFFRPNEGESNWLRPRGRALRGKTLTDERVGATGVEFYYNQHLRGQHAYRTWRLKLQPGTVRGGEPEREPLRSVRPNRGGDVKLTLDLAVQRAAEKALAESGFKGAAVFLDPHSGGVVAMASYPAFDPSAFIRDRSDERVMLMKHPDNPLLCRAYKGRYPPGSVFKTIVGTAALEEKAISPGTTFSCNHGVRVGNIWFECLSAHGTLDFFRGLKYSCNSYFYHTGMVLERKCQRPGADAEKRRLGGLGYWGRAFGMGQPTGIDLPAEASGSMPNRDWKRRRARSRGDAVWTDGDSCNVAIGQGAVDVTPLQAAVAMAAIANGGKIVRPHVLLELNPDGPPVPRDSDARPPRNVVRWRLPLASGSHTLRTVRRAMVMVVNDLGTGRLAKMPNVIVAGKTGSAENPHGRTHAWFCGFAPADDPTIAFAVVLENAGHGGAESAPLAKKVLQILFPSGEPEGEGRG